MNTEVRRAAQVATEEAIYKGQEAAIMRDNLIEMLEKDGIQSVSYLRNGTVCHMQLDKYAELVSRTTETEIRNIAALNLGYRIDNDLVEISEHWGSCPICSPYQGRVYSVSGNDPRYPYLYDTPWDDSYQNFHPNCAHVLTQYIEELHDEDENAYKQEYSNRSFEIGGEGWTKAQTERAEKSLEAYRTQQEQNRRIYDNRKQYQKMIAVVGKENMPSFSGYVRGKTVNSEAYRLNLADYRLRNRLIENPSLALPNAEKVEIDSRKFTNYFFGGENKDGLTKGLAFSSRLGYNINNWENMRNGIKKNATAYPAVQSRKNEFGTYYDQKMVLRGIKGKGMRINTVWEMNNESGEQRFITTYPD